MRRLTKRLVTLPHLTPRLWLTSELANTLELMLRAGPTGITLDYLERNGISDPSARLEQLTQGGAVIHVEVRLAQNPYTSAFEDIPHYIFKGWIQ